jgi:hypothetical protein
MISIERENCDLYYHMKRLFTISCSPCIQNQTPLPLKSMSLNKIYKLFSRSSKDGSDILFSYLKFQIVRWLEKIEISGKMLLQDSPISSK